MQNKKNKSEKINFNEKVLKFLYYDDLIKKTKEQYKKELKELKNQKKQMESFIINYLNHIDNDIINQGGKEILKKVEKKRGDKNMFELVRR
jgi:hypothetical protein